MKHKSLLTILLFGGLLFMITLLGAFWVEPYSGSCMFVLLAYFDALVIVLPMLLVKRFGVGAAVYLPYALAGLPFEYFFEWQSQRVLLSPWYAFFWALLGPLAGLCLDAAYRMMAKHGSERMRAITLGALLGLLTFWFTRWGLESFYIPSYVVVHLHYFQSGLLFSLPWMVINGAFGGYTAYSISHGERISQIILRHGG